LFFVRRTKRIMIVKRKHKYQNIISLGYFCSIALELERMGLRSCSSPFDWCITDFEGVIKLIDNDFKDLFNEDLLYQNNSNRAYYMNCKYKIQFFHDFNQNETLIEQLPLVREKYNRRIQRFYSMIQQPTLFIRYISSEDGNAELRYIEEKYEWILAMLKKYNSQNEIIFIADESISSNIIEIYYVERDKGDVVARYPLTQNQELYRFVNHISVKRRWRNKVRYFFKVKKKNMYYRLEKIFPKKEKIDNLGQVYMHDKTY